MAKDPVENRSPILRVFLPFVFGYYIAYLFRTINAVMAAPLATELGLGADDLGLLTSVYFVTFAAAQIPVGILLDRYGPRRVQSVLLLVAAVGSTLFAVSDHFLMLLLGRALIGLGVASAMTAGLKGEQPLNQILQSIQGPVAKILAVIIIITTGLTLAFGDTSAGFRRLIQIVFGLSIAFAASSFFLAFFAFGGGVLV